MKGQGKQEIPEKTRRPTASSGIIPTCENPGTRPGIEPGSPWWEASVATAAPTVSGLQLIFGHCSLPRPDAVTRELEMSSPRVPSWKGHAAPARTTQGHGRLETASTSEPASRKSKIKRPPTDQLRMAAWLKEFCTFGAETRGSARGDRDMRFDSLIAFTCKALNWRAVLSLKQSPGCRPLNLLTAGNLYSKVQSIVFIASQYPSKRSVSKGQRWSWLSRAGRSLLASDLRKGVYPRHKIRYALQCERTARAMTSGERRSALLWSSAGGDVIHTSAKRGANLPPSGELLDRTFSTEQKRSTSPGIVASRRGPPPEPLAHARGHTRIVTSKARLQHHLPRSEIK
ncbi:hypothetical protein PR048_028648 [Dryococelus australis]|uniref:Uncharacterized protein n=1 Tax=Dryococelus australis TaxID=614101 RepID=A0ABQ9GB60_9NEOP|nr:hypothetical protein PR048_028648 [Dryococelus australis]